MCTANFAVRFKHTIPSSLVWGFKNADNDFFFLSIISNYNWCELGLEELQAEHAMGRLKNYFDMKYAR